MVVLTHTTGNANSRQALLALYERKMLQAFYTALVWDPASPWNRVLPQGARTQLSRRSFPDVPPSFIHSAPAHELCRVVLERIGPRFLARSPRSPFSYKQCAIHFDCVVARALAAKPPSAVYGYTTGALETFRVARKLGITTVYEVPTAHWHFMNRLLEEERELEPEFAATIPAIRTDPSWTARQDEELALADQVVVPCAYVRSSLPAELNVPVHVIPYGCPAVPNHLQPRSANRQGKLRVLFVGNLSQAKGISYLLKSVAELGGELELTIIGKRTGPCKPLDEALRTCRWIESVPHSTVLREMEENDVLAFPSLSEGYGLVILEAMSRGMVVIATSNSGARESITDGLNGFVVPIRSSQSFVEKLLALSSDRELLRTLSAGAMARARELGWERYREQLGTTMANILKKTGEFAFA